MALAISITKVASDGQDCVVYFNIMPSGNYVVGGDTLDFTKTTQDAAFVGQAAMIPTSQPPVNLQVADCGGNITNGFVPVLGTTQANCKLKVTTAFNTELTAIPYVAPMTTTGKLQGTAVFQKLL